MDLRDIEYFAVLAEHRHVGRAAEALGLGQPALSMSLRRLEKSAGAKLVKRTPKGVELTAVGAALLSHVQRLRLARDDLAREIADLGHGRAGQLRIGAGSASAETLLPDACSALLKEAPKVVLRITVNANNDVLLPALRNAELDVAVNHVRQAATQGLTQESLGEDEFIVYASADHRLARLKAVALSDLTQERWAMTEASAFYAQQSLQSVFADRGLPPPLISLVSESAMLNRHAVATTNLLGFATKRAVQAIAPHFRLTIIPLRDMKWVRPVAVFYRKDGYLSPVARRFIDILKSTARHESSPTFKLDSR